jgi:hypothetical protein
MSSWKRTEGDRPMTEAPAADPTIDKRAGTSIFGKQGKMYSYERVADADDDDKKKTTYHTGRKGSFYTFNNVRKSHIPPPDFGLMVTLPLLSARK